MQSRLAELQRRGGGEDAGVRDDAVEMGALESGDGALNTGRPTGTFSSASSPGHPYSGDHHAAGLPEPPAFVPGSSSSSSNMHNGADQAPFMADFFAEVEKIKHGIEAIEAASKRVRAITDERMLAVSATKEQTLKQELSPLIDRTNATLKATKARLERMADETTRKRNELKPSEARIRDNLATTLKRKFGDVAKEYQREQQHYKAEVQKTVKRQLETVLDRDVTNDEVDQVVRSGGTSDVYRAAVLQGAADPIKAVYADVADKYADVLKLEQSVAELHQMFLDFALLTEQQGELLDQIEYQVKSANEYIEDGNRDIEVAIVYQKEIRKKWCCIMSIILVVVGVIVVVVYIQAEGTGGGGGDRRRLRA